MTRRLLQLLRPSADSVRALALRETDPQRYRDFEPIAWGPVGNGLVLALVAAAAIVTLPFRLLIGALWKR